MTAKWVTAKTGGKAVPKRKLEDKEEKEDEEEKTATEEEK